MPCSIFTLTYCTASAAEDLPVQQESVQGDNDLAAGGCLAVLSCCTHLLHSVAVLIRCTHLLNSFAALTCCTHLLHSLAGCTHLLHSLAAVARTCCTRLLHPVAALTTGCTHSLAAPTCWTHPLASPHSLAVLTYLLHTIVTLAWLAYLLHSLAALPRVNVSCEWPTHLLQLLAAAACCTHLLCTGCS